MVDLSSSLCKRLPDDTRWFQWPFSIAFCMFPGRVCLAKVFFFARRKEMNITLEESTGECCPKGETIMEQAPKINGCNMHVSKNKIECLMMFNDV